MSMTTSAVSAAFQHPSNGYVYGFASTEEKGAMVWVFDMPSSVSGFNG
jgi:hypothetical protein